MTKRKADRDRLIVEDECQKCAKVDELIHFRGEFKFPLLCPDCITLANDYAAQRKTRDITYRQIIEEFMSGKWRLLYLKVPPPL